MYYISGTEEAVVIIPGLKVAACKIIDIEIIENKVVWGFKVLVRNPRYKFWS